MHFPLHIRNLTATVKLMVAAVLLILTAPIAHTLPSFMQAGQTAAPAARTSAPTAAPQQQTFTLETTTLPLRQATPSYTLPRPQAATPQVATPQSAPTAPRSAASMTSFQPAAGNSTTTYRLGAGDKIRLIIFGEEELSGEYEIDGTGSLSLPLIGQVRAGGLSAQQLEGTLTQQYSNGYLIAPRISIEVMNFRPFYIVGEVNAPGNYPYINGLTVLNAVAVAGGYTPRAKKDKIILKRITNGREDIQTVGEATPVLPGDVIEIKERFF